MFNQTRQNLITFDNQHEFERLAADVLNSLGYENVEPMAPLGGADGGIDVNYTNGDAEGIAFVTLRKDIRAKFFEDLESCQKTSGEISLFSTVDITPKQKGEFAKEAINKGMTLEVYDLERIRSLFDSTLKDLRRRYLGIDDDLSNQIKDNLLKLIRFSNTQQKEVKTKTILEKMFLNKLPQSVFSLLINYELNLVKEIPGIGTELEKFMVRYDSFIGELIKEENQLLTLIGKYEPCRFREAWNIHFKYSVMRFNKMSISDIQDSGSFLNYDITWESAEKVYNQLLENKVLETLLKPLMIEYEELIKQCQGFTEHPLFG